MDPGGDALINKSFLEGTLPILTGRHLNGPVFLVFLLQSDENLNRILLHLLVSEGNVWKFRNRLVGVLELS